MKKHYETPVCEITELIAEQFFAASQEKGDGSFGIDDYIEEEWI